MRFISLVAVVYLRVQSYAAASSLTLAGPQPNGWTYESDGHIDLELEANLAIDLGSLYEKWQSKSEKLNLYENGRNQNQGLTLRDLVKVDMTSIETPVREAPLRNYYVNCFYQIGQLDGEENGKFDGSEMYNYADTLILDIFDAEDSASTPSRGIEKEAIVIIGTWMQVYLSLYSLMEHCQEEREYYYFKGETALNRAAALWIGRLQVYGDNTSGTLMYNLVERASVNFNQDQGEAAVNRKFISLLDEIQKAYYDSCKVEGLRLKGYRDIYRLINDIVGVMFTPLIQNLIHYITTDSDHKLIELYLLALLPQIRSCNPEQFEVFFSRIGPLSSGDYSAEELVGIIKPLQSMYSCFGTTCNDVGYHASGIGCVDEIADPNPALKGYNPKNDVRNFVKFQRDINQIAMLLEESNAESPQELYREGKNVKNMKGESQLQGSTDSFFYSLQDLALFSDLRNVTIEEPHRLYSMYKKFYNYSSDFAHDIILDEFGKNGAKYTIPVLLQALVLPQYAIRSLFAAVDVCINGEYDQAEHFWDRGVAILVGFSEETVDMDSNVGVNWWSLGYEYCTHFQCVKNEIYPSLDKMMRNFELGRQSIERSDCAGIKKRVQAMESIVLIPIIQALLYHSGKRQETENDSENNFHYWTAYAFGKAIMPVISERRKADVDFIRESLYNPGQYDASTLWTAIILALPDLGIDCKDIGQDTLNILGGESFCDYMSTTSEFPTLSPNVDTPRSPTALPTQTPTYSSSSFEINPVVIDGYIFQNQTEASERAKISLDLQEFLKLRGHIDIEHAKAKEIYEEGIHSSESLMELGRFMKEKMTNDPFFNLYRSSFKDDPLFQQGSGEESYYAHKIFTDALEADTDVELAYETAICMIIWMEVAHLLHAALNNCVMGGELALKNLDEALALYVGLGQTKGSTDGFLLYSFAQKAANVFGTVEQESGEALANKSMLKYFKDARVYAESCDDELRSLVGSMMSQMNIPLVQGFAHQLQLVSQTDRGSSYAILYGLSVLPQVATCQPTDYEYLTKEMKVIENGSDVPNIENLISTFKSTFRCFGVTCSDIYGNNPEQCDTFTSTVQDTYAGFKTHHDVLANALVDQDILKIKAFLSVNATVPAMDYYEHGHLIHSSIQNRKSLHELATDSGLKGNQFFDQVRRYHTDDSFADTNIIRPALKKEGSFANISADDQSSLVVRSLQILVLLPTAIGHMYRASSMTGNDCIYEHWDKGVVYLLGSIEGPRWGGDAEHNGVGMYGFAKELCDKFKVCTSSGNAESNELLFKHFSTGKDIISEGNCENLEQLIETKIVPTLLTSLVQGAIYFAGQSFHRGDARVVAEAILPFLPSGELFKGNVQIIKDNLRLDFVGNSSEVVGSFTDILVNMTVDCAGVGILDGDETLTLCKETNDPDESTDLSDGLYITRTSVKDRAKIGLDVRDMIKSLEKKHVDAAEIMYTQGQNSGIFDKDGKWLEDRSIASLGNNYTSEMKEEPVYNLYQFTLGDELYAHNIVLRLFDDFDNFNSNHETLPAEAAVALVIWGTIVHELYETIFRCSIFDSTTDRDGVHSIDEAVAYWIGEGQETGSETNGFLMYRLAEEGAELFGQKQDGNQSPTNKNVLKLFKEIALHLAFEEACIESVRKHSTLTLIQSITNRLLAQMTIPLIQHLIYNLKRNDRLRVKIYAQSVVPLLGSCTPEIYNFLKRKLVVAKDYAVAEVDEIIGYLQSSYSCLGLKCNDIGKLQDFSIPPCLDRNEINSFGGFTATTDVHEYSDIELDIRFIDIMMTQGSKQAASDTYKFGKHSFITENNKRRTLSLRELAITEGREVVPSYEVFQKYYEISGLRDTNALIECYFNLHSQCDLGSLEQNTAIVTSALKYEVLYFAALQNLYDAVNGCNSFDNNRFFQARRKWDSAAAMIIGATDSKSNGTLIYKLIASQCAEFNMCDAMTGESAINKKIEDSLNAGSYLLRFRSCENVNTYALNIEMLLKVSFIQATFSYSIKNSKLPAGTSDPSFAEGYIISRSILPYIHEVDASAAKDIAEKMDKPDDVFDALKRAISKMDDIDCEDVGVLETGEDFCGPAKSGSATSPEKKHWFIVMIGIPLSVTAIMLLEI